MYQQQTIGRSLPIIAKVVAGQLGVEVVFEDRLNAFFDHDSRKICLPSLKAIGSEDDAVVIEGLLDHEAAHVRFSDRDYTELGIKKGHVFNSFRNLIEDIRIERAIAQVFPGSKKNLNRTAGLMRKLGFFTEPEVDAHPASKLSAMMLYALRFQELGHGFCQDWVQPAIDYARQDFGDVADKVLECARAATQLGQTPADVHRAVETIMAMLKASAQEQPQSSQSQSQQGASGRHDPSTEGEGASASAPSTSDADKTEGSGSADDASASTSQQSGAVEGSQDSSAESESSQSGESQPQMSKAQANGNGSGASAGRCDPSAAQAVLDASESDMGSLAKGLEELIRESGLLEGKGAKATEVERVSSTLPYADPNVYRQHINAARKATTSIALKLDQLLQSRNDVDRHLAYTGRIDTRRLARTRIGDVRIFERRNEHEAINTAVYMVLDRSGSMDGSISSVYLAAASMGEVMSRFDVKVAAAMFDDDIVPIGKFDEPWRTAVSRMHLSPRGGTLMGAATTFAVGHLAKQTEERKILMYVTDGEPSSFEALKAAVQESRRYGIEATAILIRPSDSFRQQFEEIMPIGVAILDEDIPVAVFKALSNLL